MTLTLGSLEAFTAVARQDIDAYICRAYDDGPRSHLGASVVGGDCARKIWSDFRWLNRDPLEAQQLRLFDRGKREEIRFIEWLRGAGWHIWDKDPATGKQWQCSLIDGHYGGSGDSIGFPPKHYPIQENMILEFKTKGTGTGFNKLKERGVKVEQPEHFAQMSTYGKNFQVKYALYFAINKNDDDMYMETVKLDWQLADDLQMRAHSLIYERNPVNVPQVSLNPTFYRCKMCDHQGTCHAGTAPQKNCRSCINSKPAPNAEWFCEKWGMNIPKEEIPKGCDAWQRIV